MLHTNILLHSVLHFVQYLIKFFISIPLAHNHIENRSLEKVCQENITYFVTRKGINK